MTKAAKNKVTKGKVTKILWIACPIVLVCLAVWLIVAYGTSPATPSVQTTSQARLTGLMLFTFTAHSNAIAVDTPRKGHSIPWKPILQMSWAVAT